VDELPKSTFSVKIHQVQVGDKSIHETLQECQRSLSSARDSLPSKKLSEEQVIFWNVQREMEDIRQTDEDLHKIPRNADIDFDFDLGFDEDEEILFSSASRYGHGESSGEYFSRGSFSPKERGERLNFQFASGPNRGFEGVGKSIMDHKKKHFFTRCLRPHDKFSDSLSEVGDGLIQSPGFAGINKPRLPKRRRIIEEDDGDSLFETAPQRKIQEDQPHQEMPITKFNFNFKPAMAPTHAVKDGSGKGYDTRTSFDEFKKALPPPPSMGGLPPSKNFYQTVSV